MYAKEILLLTGSPFCFTIGKNAINSTFPVNYSVDIVIIYQAQEAECLRSVQI